MNRPWTDSWAFWAGLLGWMVGPIYLFAAWVQRRSRRFERGTGVLPAASAAGRTRAIAPLASPASGHECVYYAERVQTDELAEKPDDFGYKDPAAMDAGVIADRECGVFLVDWDGETALVWPAGGRLDFAGGWSGRQGAGKTVYERYLRPGAAVTVSGDPGSFSEMMSEMSAAATELPPDFLRALQTREDLRALNCYWGQGVLVSEGAPAERGGGDQEAEPWLETAAAAVMMLLGSLLLYLSYTHFL